MTTPFQPPPDGAYVIDDGGGSYNYGQGLNDASAAHLMIGGFSAIAGIGNPLEAVAAAFSQFRDMLLTLPLELLRLFEPMIPDVIVGAFETVAGAADAIIGYFQTLGPVLTSTFVDFLNNSFNVLSTIVNQILDILNGLFVTPVNDLVQGVKDWFTSVQQTGAGVGDLVGGLVSGVVGGVGGFFDALGALLGQGPSAIPAYTPQNSAIANVQGQINSIQAQISSTGEGAADGFNYPPISADWVSIYNSVDIADGGYVVPPHPGTAGSYYTCQRWNGAIPDTTLWQVQMTVIFPNAGGAQAAFGRSRFGGGANTALDNRFPAVELFVDQFGTWVRLGSLDGPVNDFNRGDVGWEQYGQTNLAGVLKTGDVLALECDEANAIYRLYLNPGPGSTPILSYLDSTNRMTRGLGFRYPWFQLNCLNDPFGVGNSWDNYYVFDRV